MEFLATYFLWFLVVAVVAAVTATVLQLRNMNNLLKGEGDPFDNVVSKFLPVALAALTAGVSFLLFAVGVIINLVNSN